MRNSLVLRGVAVWTASLGLLCPPQFLMAAGDNASVAQVSATGTTLTPAAHEAVLRIHDVELGQNDQVVGQVVSAQGQPVAGAAVTLRNQSKQLLAVSNAQGQFQFLGLTGGTYRLETGNHGELCRLWKYGTAPPKANQKMLLVQHDGQIALGQDCGSPVCGSKVRGGPSRAKRLLTHPLVIGGLVAAAIAIPVAIHNADDDEGSSETPNP